MYVKVTDSSFVRDTSSFALLNTDNNAKDEYLMKSKILNMKKKEIQQINNEINEIKNDINEIKSLLLQILSDKK